MHTILTIVTKRYDHSLINMASPKWPRLPPNVYLFVDYPQSEKSGGCDLAGEFSPHSKEASRARGLTSHRPTARKLAQRPNFRALGNGCDGHWRFGGG